MSEAVLEIKDLGISFGGLKAVQHVNLKVEKNQLHGLVGPNGAGKTTVFNMLTGVYQPTTGTFYLNGEELKGKTQEQINRKGIARTFQNIRLFNNMSVLVSLSSHALISSSRLFALSIDIKASSCLMTPSLVGKSFERVFNQSSLG